MKTATTSTGARAYVISHTGKLHLPRRGTAPDAVEARGRCDAEGEQIKVQPVQYGPADHCQACRR